MEWIDLAQAGEWLLAAWVFTMVAVGVLAIGAEIWRRRRQDPRAVRRAEDER